MGTVRYNKAVRDKIPEIIGQSDRTCNVKTLSDSEYLAELEKKLGEELQEYHQSKNIEELVDILEVIYRIAELRGVSKEEIEKIRIKKSDERGGFEKNLFLIDTSKES